MNRRKPKTDPKDYRNINISIPAEVEKVLICSLQRKISFYEIDSLSIGFKLTENITLLNYADI